MTINIGGNIIFPVVENGLTMRVKRCFLRRYSSVKTQITSSLLGFFPLESQIRNIIFIRSIRDRRNGGIPARIWRTITVARMGGYGSRWSGVVREVSCSP